MMKDNLEQFVSQNREAFDHRRPSAAAWEAIENELEEEHSSPIVSGRFRIWRFTRIAAAVLLLICTGIFIGRQSVHTSSDDLSSIYERYPEFSEISKYYQQEVQQKKAQLASYQVDQSLEHDLQQLDELTKELKMEFEEAPAGTEEQIINAMISNYQTKLEILERVLERVQSTNQKNANSKDENSIDI